MACPRCRLNLSLSKGKPEFLVPRRRAFHTSPAHQRLGAYTYPQEWQTGTYHFNKATQKTYPVAAQHTDKLLNQWLTQQKKRAVSDPAAYQLLLKSSITAQRRQTDRVFVSKSTAKDFGDRVQVNAFIYDGVQAAADEQQRRKQARMGVKPDSKEGGAGQRRRPRRLRAMSSTTGSPANPDATPRRRFGGARGSSSGPATGFRRPIMSNAARGGTGTRTPRGPAAGPSRTSSGGPPRGPRQY